jgi:hypothetical protein
MDKQQHYFVKVEEFKERFRLLSTEEIIQRQNQPSLTKEAVVAYREVLKERGERD